MNEIQSADEVDETFSGTATADANGHSHIEDRE